MYPMVMILFNLVRCIQCFQLYLNVFRCIRLVLLVKMYTTVSDVSKCIWCISQHLSFKKWIFCIRRKNTICILLYPLYCRRARNAPKKKREREVESWTPIFLNSAKHRSWDFWRRAERRLEATLQCLLRQTRGGRKEKAAAFTIWFCRSRGCCFLLSRALELLALLGKAL